MRSENRARAGNRSNYDSALAQSSLFYKCDEFVDRQAKNVQGIVEESGPSNLEQPASTAPQIGSDGMQIFRESWYERANSPDIADIIMLSIADVIKTVQSVHLKIDSIL